MKNKLVVLLILFIELVIYNRINATSAFSKCKQEEIVFENSNGLRLNGVLKIPDNFLQKNKLIILITPPTRSDRNYFGFFKFISDSLCKEGFTTLTFDNRCFTFSNLYTGECDMFDQATDVEGAIKFVKSDSRFEKTTIGLLGHSEGGASAVIEASLNKNVDFLILLATPGISGKELSLTQFNYMLRGKQNNPLTSTMKQMFNDKVNLITSKMNFNIMCKELKKLNSKYFKTLYKHNKKLNLSTYQVQDSTYWLSKHRIAYTNYNPQLYFTKITCPVLIVFGDKDEQCFYKQNIESFNRLFDSIGKQDYEVIVLKNVNHNFEVQDFLYETLPNSISIHRKEDTMPNFSKDLISSILNWNVLTKTD